MTSKRREPTSQPPQPDPHQRIAELEAEVSTLRHTLDRLTEKLDGYEDRAETDPERGRGLRETLDTFFRGQGGETLESRIGGIWLSRLAVVLAMTAIVLGGAMTLGDDTLTPIQRVSIGYALAALAIAYGWFRSRSRNRFAQTMLGGGMATLYFTTYAAFLVENTNVFPDDRFALPVLLACLVAIAVVCHIRRSETAAGISLFLIYYTVVLSLGEHRTLEEVIYGLATCLLVSLIAVIFHATHRWFLFTWGALLATHATYVYFFILYPPQLDLSPEDFFWVSNGFLAISYVLFSMACIIDGSRRGNLRHVIAPMATVNSAVFLALMWFAVRQTYPDLQWAFHLGVAALLLIFALAARLFGSPRNYLFQIFIAKAVVVFTLALQSYLRLEWLLVATSVEALALAWWHRRTGIVLFKVMGLALLWITFVSALLSIDLPGMVRFRDYAVQANWFCAIGVTIVFAFISAFYENFVRPVARESQFLAGTFLDVSAHTAAMWHAGAGTLLVLTITISEFGSDPMLPYFLGAAAIIMAACGFLLRTPPIEVASVLLLVAAHLCYHAFLIAGFGGFEAQPGYALYTSLLVASTIIGGFLWERYLQHVERGRPWADHALTAVPYLAATLMLLTLLNRVLPPLDAAVALSALGAAMLLLGAALAFRGLRASSLLAIAFAAAQYLQRLYRSPEPLTELQNFLAMTGVLLLTFLLAERFVSLWDRHHDRPALLKTATRAALVATTAVLGLLALWQWAPSNYLSFYWVGLAVAMMLAGVIVRESQYRWAAILIYLVAISRAYIYDLTTLTPLYRFLSFAALCVPLLVISWAYSQYRIRANRKITPAAADPLHDG